MAKCHRSDVGSVVLDRHGGGGSFRSWSAFSGAAAFRRMIFDTMRCGVSRHRREGIDSESDVVESVEQLQRRERSEAKATKEKKRNGGSEKLSDLLSYSEASEVGLEETEAETKRKVEALEEFQGVVKRLQSGGGGGEDQREAALAVRKLAREDSEARETLAMLGAIPPLVGMLDSDDPDVQIASLYALLNLGIGNDVNKAAIVKAGAVHKMLKLIQSTNASVSEAAVANFLGLSALDANKPIIGSSGAVSFLVKILQNSDKSSGWRQARQDALKAIYNLSISSSNITHLLETDLVPFLMNTLGDMEVSDRILSILSNVVSTGEGRKAVSNSPDSFHILVDVLHWSDSPSCQEKVSYILMVMAHKGYGDRQAMIEAGIVSSLLELTLLGSTLAQKRASRILECLRVDKGKQVSENYSVSLGTAVSAPICGSSSSSVGGANRNLKQSLDEVDEVMMSEERKAVKQLVQRSLQNNMRRIVKRANLPQDFVPSEHFKSLTTTSTSKSLPF